MYPEPEKFMPERWLDTSKEPPLFSTKMGFGFGRRSVVLMFFFPSKIEDDTFHVTAFVPEGTSRKTRSVD